MRRPFLLAAFTAFLPALAFTTASRDAHALGPIDLEVGARVGGATNPASPAPNPLGVGIGGRAGVAFFNIYAGVEVIDYLGSSQTVDGTSVSDHALLYGLDLGYNFKISILTIRPQLGLGNADFTSSGGGVSNSSSHFYLEPGGTALISLGLFFVGADANALILPNVTLPSVSGGAGSNKTETAFTAHGQVGVRF
jgi:hypothetical protein